MYVPNARYILVNLFVYICGPEISSGSPAELQCKTDVFPLSLSLNEIVAEKLRMNEAALGKWCPAVRRLMWLSAGSRAVTLAASDNHYLLSTCS